MLFITRLRAFALVFIFAACTWPGYSTAQSTDPEIAELQQVTQWAQNNDAIMQQLISVFEDPDFSFLMEKLSDPDYQDTETLNMRYDQWQRSSKAFFSALETDVQSRPRPPKLIELRKLQPSYDAQYDMTGDMFESIRDVVNKSQTYIEQALTGNMAGIDKIRALQIQSIISMLISESLGLRNSLLSADTSHPQTHLGQTSIHSNEFIIAVLKAKQDALKGRSNLTDRQTHIADIQAAIKDGKDAISKGQRAQKSMTRTMKRGLKQTSDSAEVHNLMVVIDMLETYDQSFAVELKFIDIQEAVQEILMRDEPFEQIEPEVDDYITQQTAIFTDRAALQTGRLGIVSRMK